MSSNLIGLEPSSVFRYFEEICQVPRMTNHSEHIREYLTNFADHNSLEYKVDAANNVVIYKNASAGYDNQRPIALQCHTDMVCEKSYELETKHDFMTDPLNLAVIDDSIFAKGTSLGSVDGIAMAMMLAVLSDDSLDHGPIEAVFLADKHADFKGAFSFDINNLTAKRMINLGHPVEGELLTSCAGGARVHMSFDMNTKEYEGNKFNLVICGLAGGHSGIEMDKCRGNANLLMGRFVHFIAKQVPVKIGYLKGGLFMHTIPREAKAEIYVEDCNVTRVEELISEFCDIIEKEYGDVEENLTLYGENLGVYKSLVLDEPSQKLVGLVLNDIPDGIIKMSRNGDDLVQTSLNCGIMRLDRNHFELFINIRSTVDCEKNALSDRLEYLTEYLNGKYEVIFNYPAWEYKAESELRDIVFDAYQRCFERNPRLTGFPAGKECSVLSNRITDLDIVSFGTSVNSYDTVKERLSVPSVAKCYDLILEVLADC